MGPGASQPAMFYVGLARGFEDTFLHKELNAEAVVKVSGGCST
jgi:hypothetical protein